MVVLGKVTPKSRTGVEAPKPVTLPSIKSEIGDVSSVSTSSGAGWGSKSDDPSDPSRSGTGDGDSKDGQTRTTWRLDPDRQPGSLFANGS